MKKKRIINFVFASAKKLLNLLRPYALDFLKAFLIAVLIKVLLT